MRHNLFAFLMIQGVLALGAARADDGPGGKSEKPAAPETYVVEERRLPIRIEREGRVEPLRERKLRVPVEHYGGPLLVKEVLLETGPAEADAPLLRLEAPRLNEELRAAREGLDQARRKLDLAEAEHKLATDAARRALERAERARRAAEEAASLFGRFQGPKMLKASELDVVGREQSLANQKEELEQLEKMYQGTTLASETKEIVLERARRSVKLAEEWLALARADRTSVTELQHPQKLRDLKDELRASNEELEGARAGARHREPPRAPPLHRDREVAPVPARSMVLDGGLLLPLRPLLRRARDPGAARGAAGLAQDLDGEHDRPPPGSRRELVRLPPLRLPQGVRDGPGPARARGRPALRLRFAPLRVSGCGQWWWSWPQSGPCSCSCSCSWPSCSSWWPCPPGPCTWP